MAGQIRIELTEADHVAACRIHVRPSAKYLIALVLISVAGCLLYAAEEGYGVIAVLGLGLATAGATLFALRLLLTPLLISGHARRLFRQTQGLQEPQDVTWDEDTLTFKANTWSASAKWIDHSKRKEGDDYFLLYINDLNFRLVPKRAFADDRSRADFARLFNAKVKPP